MLELLRVSLSLKIPTYVPQLIFHPTWNKPLNVYWLILIDINSDYSNDNGEYNNVNRVYFVEVENDIQFTYIAKILIK